MEMVRTEGYEERMNTVVIPYLDPYKENRYFNPDGRGEIYYEKYCRESPKGVVLIAHGFTESAQKYVEMVYYFHQGGYQVYSMDMRGHGRSVREVQDLSMVHIAHYEDYVEDLEYLADKIARKENPGLPLYLYGHSMGGGVSAALLEKRPELFKKAVLSSPMIKPKTGNTPFAIAYVAAVAQVWLGKGKTYVAGHHGFRDDETFQSSAAVSRERYEYYYRQRLKEPLFQTSGASYGWLREAIRLSKHVRRRANCRKIRAGVLLFQAKQDDYVENKAQRQFARNIKDVRLIPVRGVKHEIYMSDDETMRKYIKKIVQFLEM